MKYKIWTKNKKKYHEKNIRLNAKKQKLTLTKKHWEMIYLFKTYNNNKKKNIVMNFYKTKKNMFIYKLFPKGVVQLKKVIGILKNSNCF